MKSLVHSIDDLAGATMLGILDAQVEYLNGINPAVYDNQDDRLVAEERLRELREKVRICKAAICEAEKREGFFVSIYSQMLKGEYQANADDFPAEGLGKD
jgi:hypothetical protein